MKFIYYYPKIKHTNIYLVFYFVIKKMSMDIILLTQNPCTTYTLVGSGDYKIKINNERFV